MKHGNHACTATRSTCRFPCRAGQADEALAAAAASAAGRYEALSAAHAALQAEAEALRGRLEAAQVGSVGGRGGDTVSLERARVAEG